MKIHRFFVEVDLSQDRIVLTSSDVVHQMTRVLKLKPGEQIELCDGRGAEALVEIMSLSPSVIVNVRSRSRNAREADVAVTLYVAILKKENFDLVVQKATEIGVREIVPMITDRTVKLSLKMDRLRTIAREAAELSGRGIIPTIHEPASLRDAARLEVTRQFDAAVICDPNAIESLTDVRGSSIAVLIGPEGGWTGEEISTAKEAGWKGKTLGKRVLRGETAAIVACGLLLASR